MEELWDDSALITAFNNAITKYKDMHGLKSKASTHNEKACEVDGSDKVNGNKGDFFSSHVLEPTNESKPEKGDIDDNAESYLDASKEDLQQPPIDDANGIQPSGDNFGAQTASLIEYERQQITQQLQQLSEQRQNLEQRLNSLQNGNLEQTTTNTVYTGYTGSEYHTHEAYPYTSNCYQCQWDAYYNSSNAWSYSTSTWQNGLQCQYCGYVNKQQDVVSEPVKTSNTNNAVTGFDASALSAVVKEAVMASGAHMKEGMQQSEFSDVAAAWFLAGYHTSRYLSKGDKLSE